VPKILKFGLFHGVFEKIRVARFFETRRTSDHPMRPCHVCMKIVNSDC